MKKNYLWLIIVMIISCSISAQEKSEHKTTVKFDPLRDPFKDLSSAVIEAEKTNKRILLDVGGEWCIWCHRLDSFFEQHADLRKYMNENFVVLKVNYSPENKNEKFLGQYPKIPGYPHIFILEKDGKFLHSQDTSKLEKKMSYDADKIMSFLKEWSLAKSKS